MSIEEFDGLLSQHGDLFSTNEYKEIVHMIASKEYNSEIFKRQSRHVNLIGAGFVRCAREIDSNDSTMKERRKLEAMETCTISTNQTVLLGVIRLAYMERESGDPRPIVKTVIVQTSDAGQSETIYERFTDEHGLLMYPVYLKPGNKYTIQLHRRSTERVYNYEVNAYKAQVHLDSGLIIQFHDNDTGPITKLILYPLPKEFAM